MMQNKNIPLFLSFILLGLGFFVLNSCDTNDDEVLFVGDSYQNIFQYIDKNPENYSKFKQLIEAGRLTDALSSYNNHLGGNNYSLFLPDNDAVDLFVASNDSYSSFNELLNDTNYVRSLVRYHVLNSQILSIDFPNGALNAPTLSNDILTVNFNIDDAGDVFYKINNEATVITDNILKSNGVIHKIDIMLQPVVYTAYEWIQNNKSIGYQIFAELLDITGLKDTLNYYVLDAFGREFYPGYTLLAESDELYNRNDIYSIDDLIRIVSPDNNNYQSITNALNQFARYHILESQVFLDQFVATNYNTYGNFPISVRIVENDLRFNIGTQIFEKIIQGEDTIVINYLELNMNESNIVTKTGPIHLLNRILFPFRPGLVTVDLGFYNEPFINSLRNTEGTFLIRKENLSFISLTGPDFIHYTKSGANIQDVPNNDYITVRGNFDFIYRTPRILPGTYEIRLMASRNSSNNAMLQVFMDGQRLDIIVDLTSGSTSASRRFHPAFLIGIVTFDQTDVHDIRIRTLKPGIMELDRITFTPINL